MTFYMSAGEFNNVNAEGLRLNYMAYGFTTKWNFHWLRRPKGTLYSGIGFGLLMEEFYCYSSRSYTDPSLFKKDGANLGFQLDIIGIRYAAFKHFGFFAELGVGNEGVFKLGYQVHW